MKALPKTNNSTVKIKYVRIYKKKATEDLTRFLGTKRGIIFRVEEINIYYKVYTNKFLI